MIWEGGMTRCDGKEGQRATLVALRRLGSDDRRSFALICALLPDIRQRRRNQAGPKLLHPTIRAVRRSLSPLVPRLFRQLKRRPPPPLPSPSRPTILLLLPTIRQFNAFRQF